MYLRIEESKIVGNEDRLINLDHVIDISKDCLHVKDNDNSYCLHLDTGKNPSNFNIFFGTDKAARDHEFEEIMSSIGRGYPLHVVGAN